MRLNKHISDAGACSRREADRLIAEGRVTVNGLRARQAPPWQAHDTQSPGHVPDAGFESAGARDHAAALHEGEMRLDANKGSISAQDRHQQGKRDNR